MTTIKRPIRAATVEALEALVWLEKDRQEELGREPIMETYGRDAFGFVAHLEFAREMK